MVSMARYSSQGGRDYNEDSVDVRDDGRRQCVVVADGLGGHGGGKTASMLAVEQITRAYFTDYGIDRTWIQSLYEGVNRAVLDCQTDACKMKTTCVSLFLEGGLAQWAHMGDSRLYHFVDGRLVFCTTDHSVSQMAVFSGEITKAQIRFHEDRNRVLRAFGADEPVKPDIGSAPVDDGAFHAFLLCTDGFWEYVLEGEMEIDLTKSDTPETWIKYMVERLEKKVAGNNDNYTAAALFYEGPADDGRDLYEYE